jgi:hypothetical protein
LKQFNDWVIQTRETFEMRLQTEQMGRSLLIWLRNQADADPSRMKTCEDLPPTWPLVFALALSTHRHICSPRFDGCCIWLGGKYGASGYQSRALGATQRSTHTGHIVKWRYPQQSITPCN